MMGLMLDEVVAETVQPDEPAEQVMGLAASCKATQCVHCQTKGYGHTPGVPRRPGTCGHWKAWLASCEEADTILPCPGLPPPPVIGAAGSGGFRGLPKPKKSWLDRTYKLFKGLSEEEARALWQEIGRNGGRLPEARKPVKLVHLRAEARGKPRKVATSVKVLPDIMEKLQFLADRAGCDPGRIAETILGAHLQAVLREEVSA